MINIGLFGVGHLGKIHLKLLREIPEFKVVGFYDIDAEASSKVKNEFDVTAFRNPDELLELCDAIDIVTPTISHHQIAIKALKSSKHIFIEKPLANTLEQAKEIMLLTEEADVKVQIGHVERFNPAFLAVAEHLNNPMFIEIHRLAQYNPRGVDVSVVLDLMIHDIDIVLSVVKSNIKKIHASGVSVLSDSPDICNARIEFDNGAVANITSSRISMKNMRKARFFQRDAYIAVDFLEKKTEMVRMKSTSSDIDDPFAIIIDLGEKGKKQLLFDNPKVEEMNAIKTELLSFADAIIKDKEPIISAEDGYSAMDIAYKIMDKIGSTLENV